MAKLTPIANRVVAELMLQDKSPHEIDWETVRDMCDDGELDAIQLDLAADIACRNLTLNGWTVCQ